MLEAGKLVSNIIIAPAIHFKVNGLAGAMRQPRGWSQGTSSCLDWPISIHLSILDWSMRPAVTGILLVIYQLGVWLGTPIGDNAENGKRYRSRGA